MRLIKVHPHFCFITCTHTHTHTHTRTHTHARTHARRRTQTHADTRTLFTARSITKSPAESPWRWMGHQMTKTFHHVLNLTFSMCVTCRAVCLGKTYERTPTQPFCLSNTHTHTHTHINLTHLPGSCLPVTFLQGLVLHQVKKQMKDQR